MFAHRGMPPPIALVIVELFLVSYLMLLNAKSSPLVELWPLNGVIIETVIVVSLIVVVTWFIFRRIASTLLFVITVLLILLIAIPVIKYPNSKLLYGPWDSAAFYSFTKWIVDRGFIASNNELYYSDQYGAHPGVGVIPATIQIMTDLNTPLTVPMYITLAASYITYILLLRISLRLGKLPSADDFPRYLQLLSIIVFLTHFSPYYMGVNVSYSYVALSLYTVIFALIKTQRWILGRLFIIGVLTYIGLLLTHYSTTVVITFYLVVMLMSLLITRIQHTRMLTLMSLLVIVIFLSYELYVDVLLSTDTIRIALNILAKLYIRELQQAGRALEIYPTLSYLDLLRFLINLYTKQIMILMTILAYGLVVVLKWREFSKVHKLLSVLLIASLPTWIAGWAGVGSLMSGARALPLIQFMLALNIILYLKSLEGSMVKKKVSLLASIVAPLYLFLTVLGFTLNYNIPTAPLIRATEGDEYTYPTWSQGAIATYSLHPIEFVENYLHQHGPHFLCMQPYTAFGLCDLLWGKPKIPPHGFTSPKATRSSEVLELIDNYNSVVIPIPSSDRALPGPVGYKNYYLIPYYHCMNYCRGKIYTNELYNLFIR